MKIEVRCGRCGKGYLVDEGKIPVDGGYVPCQACGTTIPLRIPAHRILRQAPAKPAHDPHRGAEMVCPRCNLHFVPAAGKTPQRPRDRATLLIVEDMEYFLQIARDALAERYDLRIARTVEEARAVLMKGSVDLMLLDLTLGHGEDGLRLLREPPGKVCPVLLFTAQDESDMYGDGWAQLKALGVDDVIIKGMNIDETLLRKVAEILGDPVAQDVFGR